ncbi:MAG: hypothetical protein JW995_07330 [Melioribacteraceae bacterium]|nr:hypothetical protein [Melioribacteraceae bacterium]
MPSFQHTWLPFLYLYIVGGLFFGSGMYIIKRTGSIDLHKKKHRFWWNVMIFGYFYFVIFHAVWTLVALYL